jgi:hypothetical protein
MQDFIILYPSDLTKTLEQGFLRRNITSEEFDGLIMSISPQGLVI